MSDYWGDEVKPVCQILERSMVLLLTLMGHDMGSSKFSRPGRVAATSNKKQKNSFAATRPCFHEGKLKEILFAATRPHGYAATQ